MHIAITGATGLLGRALLMDLASSDHTVSAGCHDVVFPESGRVRVQPLDLTDPRSIGAFVDASQADCIIHTAAMTHVDRCETEPDAAAALNTTATRDLMSALTGSQTRVVYLSTDFVFDGVDGPYDESAPPHPINVYGRTKLAGEGAVQMAGDRHTIIRAAGFLGIGTSDRPTFAEAMLARMTDDPPLPAAQDQRSNITPVEYLSQAIIEIAERELSGTWHVAGEEIVSRAEFAGRLANAFGLNAATVSAVPYRTLARPAARPLNGGLVTVKARSELSVQPPSLTDAIRLWQNALRS